jgi:2-methylcitrate dehydratase PrpD
MVPGKGNDRFMPTAAQILGKFAAELKFEDIPHAAIKRAKDCIIDIVGVSTFGSRFPWSGMVADYARRYGKGGSCSLIGLPGERVHAPYAALANGTFANAFEQDSSYYPQAGAHSGSPLVPPVLAACEETGANGKTAITAYVAACEVNYRIGEAAHHGRQSPEPLGFHAPGLAGPYGAAVAAGRVLGLDAGQMTHALGIAGSLSSGILALTQSKQGGMVKRLHLGRAAESGVLAARLASMGHTGPETVLEGKFGYLDVYCREGDPARLTAGLGQEWKTLCIAMKRYALHGTAQIPVQSLRELMVEHAFTGNDVAKVVVEGSKKLMTHHNIVEPGEIMHAQYSIPFCVALALFRDPENPRSIDDSALQDPAIRAACRSTVELRERPEVGNSFNARVVVRLKDGREFTRDAETFKGKPDNPLSRDELRRKFLLSVGGDEDAGVRIFERLEHLEAQPRFTLA